MESKSKKRILKWKILNIDAARIIWSQSGHQCWDIREWYSVRGGISLCSNGFHCSDTILQAMKFVRGDVIAQVEVKGHHVKDWEKSAWRHMRIVKAYRWTNRDMRSLMAFLKKTLRYKPWSYDGSSTLFDMYYVVDEFRGTGYIQEEETKVIQKWIENRLKTKERIK